MDKIFETVDTAQTGQIEFSEFLVAATNMQDMCSDQQLEVAFKRFDVSNTGFISCDDVKAVLLADGQDKQLPAGVVEQIISQMDQNQDNQISFAEFSEYIRKV